MYAKCYVVTTFNRHLVFDVLFYERKDCPRAFKVHTHFWHVAVLLQGEKIPPTLFYSETNLKAIYENQMNHRMNFIIFI